MQRAPQSGKPTDPYAALGQQSELFDIIHELALAILQVRTLDDLVWLVAKSTIAKLGFEDCVIYLLDESRNVLVQRAAFGPKSPQGQRIVNPIEIPVGKGIVGTVALTRQPELINDVTQDARYIVDDEARQSELAVPIVLEDQVLGVIDSEHSKGDFYTFRHLEMITIIASMASTRIAALLTIERLNETISQLEATRNALRLGERQFRDLYNRHPSMFFSIDAEGIIVSTNDYACQQLDFSRDELEGKPLSSLIANVAERSVEEEIAACLSGPRETHRWEGSIQCRGGEEMRLRLTARSQVPGDERDASVLIVAEDITEAHFLSQELRFNASHDWLTGLFNRREFERQLADVVSEGRLTGEHHVLCFMDLDQFKVVNDTCGHTAGDELLRYVAQRLLEHVRRSDVVGRIGGDEFAILVRNCTLSDARKSAKVLLDRISEEPFHCDSQVFSLGASVGIASLAVGEGTVDDALSAADAACLSAKEQGRNRVHVFRERDTDITRRRGETRWISRITRSISEDAFILYFQPIVPPGETDREWEYAEILLRMIDEDGSLVLPGAFIPAAERFGLAVRVDQWVVEHTIDWLAGARANGALERTLAINLSGATVGQWDFLDFVVDKLEGTGVDPACLCFEITETTAVADPVRARKFINQLQSLGCRFALDDFGSGLSSFGYLKTFQVDFLKIDGVFIRDVSVDPVCFAMVKSINDIGHLTGKQTIAEFVHNEDVLRTVREIGVDYAQGFGISRPMPLANLS